MPVSPLQAATDVFDRADALLGLDAPAQPDALRMDVRRLAWAMGVAGIDTYLHWLVRSVDLDGPLPASLAKLDIPFGTLVESGQKSVENRNKGIKDHPKWRARNALYERILRDSYQRSSAVENALALAGRRKFWEPLAAALGEQPKEVKDHLDRLAHRRNSIVHEGDLKRLVKPQKVTRQSLTAAEVRAELDWIRAFIHALNAAI